MVEITHKGAWFQWSSLEARDKGWFLLSTLAAVPLGMVLGVPIVRWSYAATYSLGRGEHGPDPVAPFLLSDAFRYAVIAGLLFGLLSLFAWWRFSLGQDELFNRIQNYALGRAGAWSVGAAIVWWLLSLGGWVGAFPLGPFILASLGLLLIFWFYAVHKWA